MINFLLKNFVNTQIGKKDGKALDVQIAELKAKLDEQERKAQEEKEWYNNLGVFLEASANMDSETQSGINNGWLVSPNSFITGTTSSYGIDLESQNTNRYYPSDLVSDDMNTVILFKLKTSYASSYMEVIIQGFKSDGSIVTYNENSSSNINQMNGCVNSDGTRVAITDGATIKIIERKVNNFEKVKEIAFAGEVVNFLRFARQEGSIFVTTNIGNLYKIEKESDDYVKKLIASAENLKFKAGFFKVAENGKVVVVSSSVNYTERVRIYELQTDGSYNIAEIRNMNQINNLITNRNFDNIIQISKDGKIIAVQITGSSGENARIRVLQKNGDGYDFIAFSNNFDNAIKSKFSWNSSQNVMNSWALLENGKGIILFIKSDTGNYTLNYYSFELKQFFLIGILYKMITENVHVKPIAIKNGDIYVIYSNTNGGSSYEGLDSYSIRFYNNISKQNLFKIRIPFKK